jgi:23S rRNA (adenine2503-C2)-methyltransferase
MEDMKSKSFAEIAEICKLQGFPAYKSKEIFRAIHQQHKKELSEITTLSLNERERLQKKYFLSALSPQKVKQGKRVEKVAFKLADGKTIETVLMEYEGERKTLCLSSQVGCPVKCLYCATGRMGFRRNLSTGEILSQVYYFSKEAGVSNIVFMGMGEPFLNYDNVLKAAHILNHPLGEGIAARKIVFSTVGIIPGIRKLAKEKEQFRLAWSLVSPYDEVRRKLISLKSLNPIDEIVNSLKDYQKRTRRRISIEYVVLGGINDRHKDADALIEIAQFLDSHVNLIQYNPIDSPDFRPGNIQLISSRLSQARVNLTIRKSFGAEIKAACGQLAGEGN